MFSLVKLCRSTVGTIFHSSFFRFFFGRSERFSETFPQLS